MQIKSLLEDYLENKIERDQDYWESLLPSNKELGSILYNNINQLQERLKQDDIIELIYALENLEKLTSSKSWKGSSFHQILDQMIGKQQNEFLGLNDVLDLFIIVTSIPNTIIATIDMAVLKEKWIRSVFKKRDLKIENISTLLETISPFRVKILHKVFENVNKIYDVESVVKYFQALDSFNCKCEEKLEKLNDLAVNHKDFLVGTSLLFVEKTQMLLQSVNVSVSKIEKIFESFQNVFTIGWTGEVFYQVIAIIVEKSSTGSLTLALDQLCNCFEIAFDYSLGANVFIEFFNALQSSIDFKSEKFSNLERKFHYKALTQFTASHEKNLNEVLNELSDLNDNLLDTSNLKNEILDISRAMDSTCGSVEPPIKDYRKCHINSWLEIVKEGSFSPTKSQKIALVQHTYEILSKQKIRDVQVLSLLLLYKSNEGALAQINTGEGKTAVIAMLAALFALDGKKVDIVTSSPELAKPQSDYLKPFYEMLGLTSSYIKVLNVQEAYKCDILYGAIDDYEADILRDEYSKQGTRSNRPFDVVIVDEVDSMLIDGKNFMVRLSSPIPGMDQVEPLLGAIWMHIDIVASKIQEANGSAYYIEDPNNPDDAQKLNMSKSEFIERCTDDHMRFLLRDKTPEESSYPEMQVPSHLREFVLKNRLKIWIEMAIYAKYRCTKGVNYIIRDKQIKIVDVKNTGVVHENMTWSDGLHQFLELKHGAKITSEQMSTNYIANPTFFKRYHSNIYGLSGTLGCIESKKFLKETYEVKLVVIPPFKIKQHVALSPIVVDVEDQWLPTVVKSCIRKLDNNRACLVIAESINAVEELEKIFLSDAFKYPKSEILIYKTEKDSSVIKKAVGKGKVIISTNLAGRGTDIQLTDEVNQNGGLHICITTLPENLRVEKQNLGRTSRTGNPGTSQFVLYDKNDRSLATLREKRDDLNLILFKSAAKDIKKIILRAKVFQKFCKILDNVNGSKTKDEEWEGIKTNDCPNDLIGDAVEERFGFWLKNNDDCIEDSDEYMDNFEQFEKLLKQDAKQGNLIQNPFYYVLSGNRLLEQKKYEQAIEQYDHAIRMDRNYSENAYYNRAFAKASLYASSNTKHFDKLDDAIRDFKATLKLIERREEEVQVIRQSCGSESSELTEQLGRKLNLLSVQKAAIHRAVGYDLASLDAQIVSLKNHKQSINSELKNFESLETLQSKQEKISKRLESLKGDSRNVDAFDELTLRKCVLDNQIQNFQPIENLEKNINEIDQSIDNLQKQKKEIGSLGKAKGKNAELKIERVGLDKILGDDEKSYAEEIKEFKRNGYLGSFEVSEVTPIDWSAVLGVLAIGIGQIIAGAAIAVFSVGAGASFALGILMEGISDVITSVKDGLVKRNFSWKSWGIQKAISYTISIACAGFSAIKNALKTAYVGVKGALSAGTAIVNQTVKEGWKLVGKKIGLELSKGIAKEIATNLINLGIDSAIIPEIEKNIEEIVRPLIEKALLNDQNVKRMLELDALNHNNHFENLIKSKAMEILYTSSNQNELVTVATSITQGIACQKIDGLSSALAIANGLKACGEVAVFVPIFMNRLKEELNTEAKKAKVDEKVAEKTANATQSQTSSTSQRSTVENVEVQANIVNDDQDIDLTKGKSEERIGCQREKSDPKAFVKNISLISATQITNIIKGKMIQPAMNSLVTKGVNGLSSSLDTVLHQELGNYQSKRRIIVNENGDRHNLLDESFKNNHKRVENMAKAEEMIEKVKNGDELGLAHMKSLSEATEIPIEVLNAEGEVMFTVGQVKPGQKIAQVQYHPPEDGATGHWTLPGNKDPPFKSSGPNDCLLNVLAHQTNKDPNQLRTSCVEKMELNKTSIANAAPDYARLETFMKSSLFLGGARYDGNLKEIIKISEGKFSHNDSKTDNNRKHTAKGHLMDHSSKTKVQKVSRGNKYQDKTAFGTEEETRDVLDMLLSSKKAQTAYDEMNGEIDKDGKRTPTWTGQSGKDLSFKGKEFTDCWDEYTKKKYGEIKPPPRVYVYKNGVETHSGIINEFVIVLRHQYNQEKDPGALVFVQTAYPKTNN